MIRVLLVTAASVLLSATGRAAGSAPWDQAEAWVGHYPSDIISGQKVRLFELPPVKSQIARLLDTTDAKLFKSYTLEAEAQKIDHFLLVNRCKVHDCPGGNVTVVLDLEAPEMWLAFETRANRIITTRWIGTKSYAILPESVRHEITSE